MKPRLRWPPPVKRDHVLHRRVRAHDVDEVGELLPHRLERDALVGLDVADQAPGVLLREETLGLDDVEVDVEADGRGEQHQHERPWRSAQASVSRSRAAAARTRARSRGTGARAAASALVPQQPRAHHRRRRQRHHQRNQDRHRQRHRELAEQPADDAAHQQDRDEHRDQRQAHRQHGEADLARAAQRRLRSALMPFSMRREMFSSTTMASSTTKPVAMVSAISDRLFRL